MARRRPHPNAPIPDVVMSVPPRLKSNDCSTWALATLTGRPYADCLQAAAKEDARAGESGLWWSQVIRMAKRLGVTLRCKRRAALHEDTGILCVTFADGTPHSVVLKQGPIILDADGTVWTAEDYLAAKGVTYSSILVIQEPT